MLNGRYQTGSGSSRILHFMPDANQPVPEAFLTLPDVERTHFEKNFIKTAVCELRFPALLEFETKPPVQLQNVLRKDFPHYERQHGVNLNDPQEKEIRHLLRSKKGDWLVSLKSSSIAIETSRYTHFDDFLKQIRLVFDRCKPLLDTDFFTRVGLRYVNEVIIEDGKVEGWIKDDLVNPLAEGVYGTVDRFFQEVRGTTKFGKYTFRHGIAGVEPNKPALYTVDFDFYSESVEAEAVLSLVSDFNRESFRFFLWVIGPKVKERLGKTTKE
jgi:uncharacterized protein (TIGR04255 family)